MNESKSPTNFPFEICDFDTQRAEESSRHLKGGPLITVGPKKYLFQQSYRDYAADIYNLEIESDDVFIVGLPRSGTNMTQELVWLLIHDMNFDIALSTNLRSRCPYLESTETDLTNYRCSQLFSDLFTNFRAAVLYVNPKTTKWFKTLDKDKRDFFESTTKHPRDLLQMNPAPRMVKTHIPMSLLPPSLLEKGKVVYLARDPRDVAVSSYHLYKNSLIMEISCDFKTYFDLFMRNRVLFSPYFEHVKEAWSYKNHPNMLLIFYEELRKDLPAVVRRMAKFFGKNYSEDQLEKLCDHLSFSNIKKNEQVNIEAINMVYSLKPDDKDNSFIRKGKAGGWREYFDEDMTAKAEEWIAENLRGSDFRFPSAE